MSIINVHHENSLLKVENLGLKADLAALRERLAAAEALSESRRVTLLAKSEELAAEWKRAETAEALVAERTRERDELAALNNNLHMEIAYSGCQRCGDTRRVEPHRDDLIEEREERDPTWEFDGPRDCPKGSSFAIADTGEYGWGCGCDPVPCDACADGKLLSAEALVRELAAVAKAANQAYEDEHGGYDALASDSQERVRELIAALSPAARKEIER